MQLLRYVRNRYVGCNTFCICTECIIQIPAVLCFKAPGQRWFINIFMDREVQINTMNNISSRAEIWGNIFSLWKKCRRVISSWKYRTFSFLSVPKVRPVGYDGNNPTSVAEWLESLELGDYTKSFLINGYTSMELVKKIWEIELINVSLIFFSFILSALLK